MSYSFCTDDFAQQPYWWDETPRPQIGDQVLPSRTDVLIVGSGYTGLQCALQTTQAGRHTTVIDSGDLGLRHDRMVKMSPALSDDLSLREAKEEVEKIHVEEALARHGGNISRTAREIGVSRPTLYAFIKKYDLESTRPIRRRT